MRQSVFESVEPAHAFDCLPLETMQTTSRMGLCIKLALLVPAVAAFSVPVVLVGSHAIAEPQILSELSVAPVTALQIIAGLAIWLLLVAVPLARLLHRAGLERHVRIGDGSVDVRDRRLLGTRAWSEQLPGYAGIAHHMRASLSGLRHELILVHGSDRAKDVLLTIAPHISQGRLERAATLLGLPVLPARAIYGRRIHLTAASSAAGADSATPEPLRLAA